VTLTLAACGGFAASNRPSQSDRLATVALTGGTPASVPILTPAPAAGDQVSLVGDPNRGRQLFVAAGCAGCHTVEGVPGASGAAGPNLTNVTLRSTLAGETIPTSPSTLVRWLIDPQSVKPGAAMPSVGLTAQQAQDLAAFLYSQPYNRVR